MDSWIPMVRDEILKVLQSVDFKESIERLREFQRRKAIQGLFSALCDRDGEIRGRAAVVLGALVAEMADENLEGAREIIRRLLWSLNEESGSIGWGAPETLGEILARSELLAREYAPILISYMDEKGNYLESEELQRGLLWALGRFAEVNPQLLRTLGAAKFIPLYLRSSDANVRGLAIRVLAAIGDESDVEKLKPFLQDASEIQIFEGWGRKIYRVADLAQKSLDRLLGRPRGSVGTSQEP
jgi:HEAT repeat protein